MIDNGQTVLLNENILSYFTDVNKSIHAKMKIYNQKIANFPAKHKKRKDVFKTKYVCKILTKDILI